MSIFENGLKYVLRNKYTNFKYKSYYIDFTRNKFDFEYLHDIDKFHLSKLIKYYDLKINPILPYEWKYSSKTSTKADLPFYQPSKLLRELMILSEMNSEENELHLFIRTFLNNLVLSKTVGQTVFHLSIETFFKRLLTVFNFMCEIYVDECYHLAYKILMNWLVRIYKLMNQPVAFSGMLNKLQNVNQLRDFSTDDPELINELGLKYIRCHNHKYIIPKDYYNKWDDSYWYRFAFVEPLFIRFKYIAIEKTSNPCLDLSRDKTFIENVNKALFDYLIKFNYEVSFEYKSTQDENYRSYIDSNIIHKILINHQIISGNVQSSFIIDFDLILIGIQVASESGSNPKECRIRHHSLFDVQNIRIVE